jgi:hypothetical protein
LRIWSRKRDQQINKGDNGDWSGADTNLERAQEALVHAHHGAGVVELSAVVGGTEESHKLTFREEFIAVLHDLMRTADQIHIMFLQEARHHVRAEGEGDTAVVLAPAGDVLVGVRPKEVAEQATVRDLGGRVSASCSDICLEDQ